MHVFFFISWFHLMKQVSALALVLSSIILIQQVLPIPPDFFRIERRMNRNVENNQFLNNYRSRGDFEDVSSLICSYCSSINYISEATCKKNLANEKKSCAIALLAELNRDGDVKNVY
ncbi:hypothetical protein HELRODRAFT_168158 [Helobdella robusta]|uniref:Uncharacterized protein n=1 Tax=Helobdella robusta TaxID=6412 RepID=T1F087_HELRO|nr:hypothetical protein HELRODRAFT_168158 [Helobdella robusta]ESO09199.1 hypothetical protein HELRODRAFT_168158 [Helobdella robusta]